MPPKAKAKAKAAARPETVLQRNVRLAIAAGNEPALSRTRGTLSMQKAGGGKIVLETKGIQTAAGVEYYRQKGTRWVPKTIQEIDWNQSPRSHSDVNVTSVPPLPVTFQGSLSLFQFGFAIGPWK